MLTPETRLRLKDLLFELNPEELSRLNASDVEKIKNNYIPKAIEVSKQGDDILRKQLSKMTGDFMSLITNVRNDISQFTTALQSVQKSIDSMTSQHKIDFASVQKSLELHKKTTGQVLEEMQDNIKISYSKMGGGNMQTLTKTITATALGAGLYSLAPMPILSELRVYVGGALTFHQNSDWTYTLAAGNHVSQITLSQSLQDDIAQGSPLNLHSLI